MFKNIRSTFRLLATMIVVSLLVTAACILVIFHITLRQKMTYLEKLSENELSILRSFYHQTNDKGKTLAVVGEQQEMHPGLEKTGEFTISFKRSDTVFLIQYKGIQKTAIPLALPVNSDIGEPSIKAASQIAGFVTGSDYKGRKVLAYCDYIPELNWGLVTQIDYSEIERPYYKAGLYAFLVSIVLVLLGAYFLKRFSDPLYNRIMESEKKYHLMFEFIPSGITITNPEGDILESNMESERLLGISRDEHVRRKIDSKEWKIIRLDGTRMPSSEFASTIALKEKHLEANVEMGIVKENNEITWLNVSASPFPLKDFGIIVVYSDITRRVEAENQLRIHDAKLEELARDLKSLNETKDKFFSILAHDLKNPFSSLLGASEYLYKDVEKHDFEKIKMLGKILYNSAKSGYDILANLLEWSRSQTGTLNFNPGKINLSEVIRNNISLVSTAANSKKIRITADVQNGLEIVADANMLNTVIRNLLTNALKFTQSGGNVIIRTESVTNEVIVSVEDSGTGIPQEDIDKLFRIDVKYVNRGTDNESGTGLGLILCKEFIAKHGGKIWVDSRLNEGSTFHFSIPVTTY
jgi:two-component system sensor histidine kinase/response regulator